MPIRLLVAHPDLPQSRVNAALLRAARDVAGVSVTDLYASYPDFFIDVPQEQEALDAHDTVILQHPLHWYGVPSLLKHWIDQVLLRGWAYGPGGEHLRDKRWGHALSCGGDASSYTASGLHQHSLDAFLLPLAHSARLCGARWQTPFVVQGADRLTPADIASQARRYADWLEHLSLTPPIR